LINPVPNFYENNFEVELQNDMGKWVLLEYTPLKPKTLLSEQVGCSKRHDNILRGYSVLPK